MWGPVNGENAALGWPQQPLEKNFKKRSCGHKDKPRQAHSCRHIWRLCTFFPVSDFTLLHFHTSISPPPVSSLSQEEFRRCLHTRQSGDLTGTLAAAQVSAAPVSWQSGWKLNTSDCEIRRSAAARLPRSLQNIMSQSLSEKNDEVKRDYWLWDTVSSGTFFFPSTGQLENCGASYTDPGGSESWDKEQSSGEVCSWLIVLSQCAATGWKMLIFLPPLSPKCVRVQNDLLPIWGPSAVAVPNDRGHWIPLGLRNLTMEGPATTERAVQLLIARFPSRLCIFTNIMSGMLPICCYKKKKKRLHGASVVS